jgi:hypothetical protein
MAILHVPCQGDVHQIEISAETLELTILDHDQSDIDTELTMQDLGVDPHTECIIALNEWLLSPRYFLCSSGLINEMLLFQIQVAWLRKALPSIKLVHGDKVTKIVKEVLYLIDRYTKTGKYNYARVVDSKLDLFKLTDYWKLHYSDHNTSKSHSSLYSVKAKLRLVLNDLVQLTNDVNNTYMSTTTDHSQCKNLPLDLNQLLFANLIIGHEFEYHQEAVRDATDKINRGLISLAIKVIEGDAKRRSR